MGNFGLFVMVHALPHKRLQRGYLFVPTLQEKHPV